jgi:predicted Zn-dependent protease
MTPSTNEKMAINGNEAHSLVYESYSDGQPVVLTLLWLEYNGKTFRFALLGLDKYREVIETMARSLHNVTVEERSLIKKTVLHIVRSNEGEDLRALSSRTGNILGLDYTALINDIEPDQVLTEDNWIKIGVITQY